LTFYNMKRLADVDCDSYVLTLPPLRTSAINPLDYIMTILNESDKPVYYYHCPGNNGAELSIDQFKTFLNHPKLKGIKNSAGDMKLRKELIMLKDQYEFTLLEGHEWAIDECLMVGCDGALCGAGALASKPMIAIAEAVNTGKIAEAVKIQHELIRIFHGIYGENLETVWVGQKYAMKYLGLIDSDNTLFQSTSLLTSQRKKEIEACIDKYRDLLD